MPKDTIPAAEEYRRLREDADAIAARLAEVHGREIVCRAGCTDCCQNLSVWPVEFYTVLEDLRAADYSHLVFNESASCGFLKDGLCQIYPFRPLICRTHGLPIAFEIETAETPEIAVSFCPKNFQNWEQKGLTFGPDNTLPIDRLNERLSQIHLRFLQEAGDESLTVHSRIPLKKLAELL
ncbi:MAG: YkgJ family cysteine cluster protein [Anaerohalosphaeraceae bacterium]